MRDDGVTAALADLQGADPDVMERDELVAFVGRLRQVMSWCRALEVRASRRTRQLADEGRAEAPENLLASGGACSGRDARAAVEREKVCDQMPSFEEALADGAVSAGHVDALAHASRHLDEQTRAEFAACEADLLADAGRMGVDAFSRACRDLARNLVAQHPSRSDAAELDAQRARSSVKRWVDEVTGMRHTHLELDPVRDEQMWKAIRHQLSTVRRRDGNRRTPWAELEVAAVVAAVGASDGDRVPEISVLVDAATLRDGVHEGTICETENGVPMPLSTVRRLCCEAEIVPIVVGDRGQALAVGRTVRTANRAQRRALAAMHRTCAGPECTVPFEHCRVHHVNVFWRDGGSTDLDNLIPVCERHHHLVHEGGWSLTMGPDRSTTWTRPDGTVWWQGSSIDRRPASRCEVHERTPDRARCRSTEVTLV